MLLVRAQADGYKKPTEDRVVVKRLPDGRTALAVFDGHGGTAVSTAAAAAFEAAANTIPTQNTSAWLKNWLSSFDTTMRKYKTVGSTATVIVVTETEIHGAYLGDSPAIVFTPEGGLLESTIDHHPSRAAEKTRIKNDGGFVEKETGDVARVNGVLAVSRALGDYEIKPAVSSEADTFTWKRPQHGYLAMMSDGMLESPRGGSLLRKTVAGILAQHIREQGANAASVAVNTQEAAMNFQGDNLSLILMDVSAVAPAAGAQAGGQLRRKTRRNRRN